MQAKMVKARLELEAQEEKARGQITLGYEAKSVYDAESMYRYVSTLFVLISKTIKV